MSGRKIWDRVTVWCGKCGELYSGDRPPKRCPNCKARNSWTDKKHLK